MLRIFTILLMLLSFAVAPAQAEEAGWTAVPQLLRPGKPVRLAFTAPEGTVDIVLADANGVVVHTLRDDLAVSGGGVNLTWDGDGVPQGSYTLCLITGSGLAEAPVTIGPAAPRVALQNISGTLGSAWAAVMDTNMAGRLTLTVDWNGEAREVAAVEAAPGSNAIYWDGKIDGELLPNGYWELTLRLTDATGFSSTPEMITIYNDSVLEYTHATDVTFHTPNEFSNVVCNHDVCYWKLNMGEMNEEKIWQVLTQPVTVLRGHDRTRIAIRTQPDENCTDYVGEVTCDSQAVHILYQEGEWTLIEAFSSCTAYSKIKIYADYMRGWVKTELLQEKPVSQKYGIVIDKLVQRLYLFEDGKLKSTLLCSTGKPTKSEPYNETPAGEFIIVSWTGGFWSGNMWCDMALRINGGILVHEVPCLIRTDDNGEEYRVYSYFEEYLGQKASHGCVRVQRDKTAEGINMRWLWENLERGGNTKVIIWDEVGRVLGYPDPDLTVYYNPQGGRLYHAVEDCHAVANRFLPLSPLAYGDLMDDDFARLNPCPDCGAEQSWKEIDEINAKNTRVYGK